MVLCPLLRPLIRPLRGCLGVVLVATAIVGGGEVVMEVMSLRREGFFWFGFSYLDFGVCGWVGLDFGGGCFWVGRR